MLSKMVEKGQNRVSKGAVAAVLAALVLMTGCAVTPVPVRVMSLSPEIPVDNSQGEKVALVVRDSRGGGVTGGSNVIGLKRNGFWVPMAVVFLAHGEQLDRIVARRMAPLLEGAGYQVTGVLPEISDQPGADLGGKEYNKRSTSGVSNARAVAQDDVKAAKKSKGEAEYVDAGIVTVEGLAETAVLGCDAVVEVRINSLYADIVPFSSLLWPFIQSWEVADVYVYAPGGGPRTVTWGKTFRTYNSVPWAPVDLGGETSYNASVNMSFRQMARKMETMFRDPQFRESVRKAGQRVSVAAR